MKISKIKDGKRKNFSFSESILWIFAFIGGCATLGWFVGYFLSIPASFLTLVGNGYIDEGAYYRFFIVTGGIVGFIMSIFVVLKGDDLSKKEE